MPERNWGGTLTYRATRLARPADLGQLRELVTTAPRVKVLGTRHSFSEVADAPDGLQISLAEMVGPAQFDDETGDVVIDAGTTYGQLLPFLAEHGRTLPALASLPHCTVAGSVATGTHGSGTAQQGLASAVTEVELMTADGELHTIGADDPRFPGAVVSIGALGVITRLRLRTVPAFEVRQDVYEPLGWQSLVEHVDAILDAAYSVSVFTPWSGPDAGHVVLKSRTDEPDPPSDLFGAARIQDQRHPAHRAGQQPTGVTEQGGVPGPAADRLPHFRLGFTPSNGNEVQCEYFVPRSEGAAAITALRAIGRSLDDLLLVSEIRSIAADEHWLSPAYGRDTVGFHFTWRPDQTGVQALLPVIEDALAPFDPRPHWGKLFVDRGRLTCYPRLADFAALREQLDPTGRFRTPYVDRVLGR